MEELATIGQNELNYDRQSTSYKQDIKILQALNHFNCNILSIKF